MLLSLKSKALFDVWMKCQLQLIAFIYRESGVEVTTSLYCIDTVLQGGQILHPNSVRLAPNGTNIALLKIRVSVHFGSHKSGTY